MAENQVSQQNSEELLKKLSEYENLLKKKDAEIVGYKDRIAHLEDEISKAPTQKQLRAKEVEEVNTLKAESEQTLTKAKSMIFERTKIIKNQELQIEAYAQQIESMKDVVRITKDLLEIRNLEVKQLENKIGCMEGKMKAEKERQELLHKKLENMIRHNGELKREYEAQLCLFAALRERYSERELARDVVDQLRTENNAENNAEKNAGNNAGNNAENNAGNNLENNAGNNAENNARNNADNPGDSPVVTNGVAEEPTADGQ